MISSVRGTVVHTAADSVVIDVSGVGYSVAVPPDVARTAGHGHELFLHTHLVVREDALSLFGFATRDELEVFGVLLGVNGVGPKSALGILSVLTIDQIASAVEAEDDKPFRKVSGIGPKTAKLIALQLQGKR
ncbi:MAG: Holliday junction branch migration protein RuvA, partial [Microbacterium gubbeenense]